MEWLPAVGYEDICEVSRQGDFRFFESGKLLRASKRKQNDYVRVDIKTEEGKKKSVAIHRLVAMSFVKGYQPGLVVNHKNGIKWDNRAENLEWVTQRENCKDAHLKGFCLGPVDKRSIDHMSPIFPEVDEYEIVD